MNVRIDKWLWAVRIFKTRSDAAEACKKNKVLLNGVIAKPSKEIKTGDVLTVHRPPVDYVYRVTGLIENRQPAKNVPMYVENITPQENLDLLDTRKSAVFVARDRGTGRPTKKERRDIDQFSDDLFDDEQ